MGFQTTYEELKHSFYDWVGELKYRFQTTYEELKPGCLTTSSGINSSFQTTYEELKHIEDGNIKIFVVRELPDYLWGIETHSQPQHRHYQRKASRLPMRNWNCLCSKRRGQLSRFQTTYEELKRLSHSQMTLQWGTCFQTTYEELKPRFTWEPFGVSLLASRLPMRNWNSSLSMASMKRFLLPDYLWGIETILCREHKEWCATLPDYLWGIETTDVVCVNAPQFGFQTTYEELKLFLVWVLLHFREEVRASRLPMRNWNETGKKSAGTSILASRLPMRNWNTFRLLSRLLPSQKLPDYLWGIETFWSRLDGKTGWASRLPMRNWNNGVGGEMMSIKISLPDYLWGIETSFFFGGIPKGG